MEKLDGIERKGKLGIVAGVACLKSGDEIR